MRLSAFSCLLVPTSLSHRVMTLRQPQRYNPVIHTRIQFCPFWWPCTLTKWKQSPFTHRDTAFLHPWKTTLSIHARTESSPFWALSTHTPGMPSSYAHLESGTHFVGLPSYTHRCPSLFQTGFSLSFLSLPLSTVAFLSLTYKLLLMTDISDLLGGEGSDGVDGWANEWKLTVMFEWCFNKTSTH